MMPIFPRYKEEKKNNNHCDYAVCGIQDKIS